MKRFIAIFISVLTCSIVGAQRIDKNGSASVTNTSIFSIDVGFASDGKIVHVMKYLLNHLPSLEKDLFIMDLVQCSEISLL